MAAGEIHVELAVNYADDPKMIALYRQPKDARGARDLYVQMLCYAKDNMTDGIVPREIVTRLAYPDSASVAKRQAALLADVELIEPHEIGWNICAYLRRNKSRVEIEALSAKRAESGRIGGKRSGQSRKSQANAKHGASVGLNTETETETESKTEVSTSVRSSPDVPRELPDGNDVRSKPVNVQAAIVSREYTDRVKLADRAKVAGVVQQAIDGGYDVAVIRAALRRLAKDSRPVTPDTLRIEIDGKGGTPAREPKAAYTPPRDGMRGREGW